jgi:hypothetical protein
MFWPYARYNLVIFSSYSRHCQHRRLPIPGSIRRLLSEKMLAVAYYQRDVSLPPLFRFSAAPMSLSRMSAKCRTSTRGISLFRRKLLGTVMCTFAGITSEREGSRTSEGCLPLANCDVATRHSRKIPKADFLSDWLLVSFDVNRHL